MDKLTNTQIALLEAAHGDATVLKFQSIDDLEAELEKIEEEVDVPDFIEGESWYRFRSVALTVFANRFLIQAYEIASILDPTNSKCSRDRFYEDYCTPHLYQIQSI